MLGQRVRGVSARDIARRIALLGTRDQRREFLLEADESITPITGYAVPCVKNKQNFPAIWKDDATTNVIYRGASSDFPSRRR